MSAPLTKGQIEFELPKLSYIDTRWEEPALPTATPATEKHGVLSSWIAGFRAWRQQMAAMAELAHMSDRELLDVGLNRGDLDRIFDDRYNMDLRRRAS